MRPEARPGEEREPHAQEDERLALREPGSSHYQISRAPICTWRGSPTPAPDRAVEVEDQVRGLRHEDVRAVEEVEDLDDRLDRDALAELELLREAHVEGGVGVVLAAGVALDDGAVRTDAVGGAGDERRLRRRGGGRAVGGDALRAERERLGRAVRVAEVHVDVAPGPARGSSRSGGAAGRGRSSRTPGRARLIRA